MRLPIMICCQLNAFYNICYLFIWSNISVRKLIKVQKGDDCVEAKWKIRVCSENNFPTAAGLASSAAGYACLGLYIFKL